MEQTVQFMDQTLQTVTAQTSGRSQNSQSGSDKADFGTMVRQKQQTVKKDDAPKNTQQKQTAKKPEAAKGEKPEAEGGEVQQMVIAAALMYTVDFTADNVQAVEEAPEEVQLDAGEFVPVLEIDFTGDVALQTEEAAPEVAVVTEETVEIAPEQYEAVEEQVARQTEAPVEAVQEEETEEEAAVEVTGYETPVFEQVDTTPVKVAETRTEEPLDLNRDEGVRELANRIENFVFNAEGDSRVEFTLVPASLGKIAVEIVRGADGALHVQLSATTLRAAELLNCHSGGLEQALAGSNRSNVQVEVKASEEAQKQLLNPNAEQQQQEQQRRQQERRQQEKDGESRPHEAQDFLQQLRLGLVELV